MQRHSGEKGGRKRLPHPFAPRLCERGGQEFSPAKPLACDNSHSGANLIRFLAAALFSVGWLAAAPAQRPSPDIAIHLSPTKQVSPTQYKGKVLLLAFIQTTCPHCQQSVQMLTGLQREYGPRGVQFL